MRVSIALDVLLHLDKEEKKYCMHCKYEKCLKENVYAVHELENL